MTGAGDGRREVCWTSRGPVLGGGVGTGGSVPTRMALCGDGGAVLLSPPWALSRRPSSQPVSTFPMQMMTTLLCLL